MPIYSLPVTDVFVYLKSRLFVLMVRLSNSDCLQRVWIHVKLNGYGKFFGIVIKDEKANGMTIYIKTMSAVMETHTKKKTEDSCGD